MVTEKKVSLARVREQVASTRGTVERLGRSHDELMARVGKLEEELEDIARADRRDRGAAGPHQRGASPSRW